MTHPASRSPSPPPVRGDFEDNLKLPSRDDFGRELDGRVHQLLDSLNPLTHQYAPQRERQARCPVPEAALSALAIKEVAPWTTLDTKIQATERRLAKLREQAKGAKGRMVDTRFEWYDASQSSGAERGSAARRLTKEGENTVKKYQKVRRAQERLAQLTAERAALQETTSFSSLVKTMNSAPAKQAAAQATEQVVKQVTKQAVSTAAKTSLKAIPVLGLLLELSGDPAL